jgi:hypothetical protein
LTDRSNSILYMSSGREMAQYSYSPRPPKLFKTLLTSSPSAIIFHISSSMFPRSFKTPIKLYTTLGDLD